MNLCNGDLGKTNFAIFIKELTNNPKITFSDLYPSKTQVMPWMRNSKDIPHCRTNLEAMKEWNMLDSKIWCSKNLNAFKNKALKITRLKANFFFNCLISKGVKIITRLQLGLSHLQDHKFKHSFQDCLNPICSCGIEV